MLCINIQLHNFAVQQDSSIDSYFDSFLLITSPFGVMASQSLEDILGDCGVTPQICSILMTAGWTIENFSCVASDESSMDEIWSELVPDFDLPLLQKSALRAAFKRCKQKIDPSGSATPTEAMASTDSAPATASWSESFAPKLDQAKINAMKEKFISCYPSEIVNHDTMPSTRLLSLVYHQLQRK